MSNTSQRVPILTTLVLGLMVSPLLAYPDDPLLKEVEARRAIEAQRVEQAIRQADRDATKIGGRDPESAIRILRGALAILDADTTLSDTKRAALKRSINLSLRAYEGRSRDIESIARAEATRQAHLAARNRQYDRNRQAQSEINRTLQDIKSLQRVGRTVEARRLASDLRRRYPDNPVVGTGVDLANRTDALADLRGIRDQRRESYLELDKSIMRSAADITEGVKFPADWVEKSKRRSPAAKLTAKERKILKSLNTPLNVDFDKDSFAEVIKYFEKRLGEPIIVHREGLADVGITYDTAVTLTSPGRISMRSALKKILAEYGLTYVIKGETVQITSVARAKDMMTTRTYYVGDLLRFSTNPFNPYSQIQAVQQIQGLMTMIQTSMDPQSWEANGGPGSIRFYAPAMAFIVRQSAEVHMMLGVGLR